MRNETINDERDRFLAAAADKKINAKQSQAL